MAQNHIQKGAVMPWTNGTGAAVLSGEPVIIGDKIGVALADIADTATGDVALEEVWQLPKTAPLVINQGDQLYLGAAGTVHKTNTDTPAGFAFADAASDATTVLVKING